MDLLTWNVHNMLVTTQVIQSYKEIQTNYIKGKSNKSGCYNNNIKLNSFNTHLISSTKIVSNLGGVFFFFFEDVPNAIRELAMKYLLCDFLIIRNLFIK